MDHKTTIKQLLDEALKIRDERNWKQYHDPKNLAAALSIETGELQELFLWKSEKEVVALSLSEEGKRRITEEVADIFIYLLFFADSMGMDISDAVREKFLINKNKYPISKSYNSNKKYTELE
jgi:NTP pyrophosphatase (non-canonical NTP hydrolase)